MEEAALLNLLRLAIEVAMIKYPRYPERGTSWPAHKINPDEAALFAYAAVKAIEAAGLEVVEKSTA